MKKSVNSDSPVFQPASKSKAQVAVIGGGLAGAMLANTLHASCRLTVFERGSLAGEKPADVRYSGHPVGLSPSFYYGLGGSTNLWTGGLINMIQEEFTASWPEKLRDALPKYYERSVARIYGEDVAAGWMQSKREKISDTAHVTSIYYPQATFRARESALYEGCNLQLGCQVLHIEDAGHQVKLTVAQNGKTRTEKFDFVVLASGGVNSPILLQKSGLGGPSVGLNYTNHPMGFVAKLSNPGNTALFDMLRAKSNGFDNTKAVMKIQDRHTGLWSAIYLRPAANLKFDSDPYVRSFKFMAQTNRWRKYLAALPHMAEQEFLYQVLENRLNIRLPSPHAYVLAVNEQEERGQGSVRHDADGVPRLDWKLSRRTVQSMTRNLHTLADILDADLHMPDKPLKKRLFTGAHHSGTCRISPDTSSGVVDETLKLHGSERIYVCDGSVLPSTGATNTGLTISALAHRLSEHMRLQFTTCARTENE